MQQNKNNTLNNQKEEGQEVTNKTFSETETQGKEKEENDFGKWGEMYGYSAKTRFASNFWREKYSSDANNYWDKFYKSNQDHFFKDRHWLYREFPELKESNLTLFEMGCGVGNTIFPLVRENPTLFVHGCDFSKTAISLIHDNPEFPTFKNNINAFVADISSPEDESLLLRVKPESVDYILLIFVFSAMNETKMTQALRNIHRVLKKGGVVLFRDYGVGDKSQTLFEKSNRCAKIEDNLYVRSDSTQAYFFTEEVLRRLFCLNLGYAAQELRLIEHFDENKKEGKQIRKVWFQCKFKKPLN